jgi:3-oxoacyl-[acyl-carrier protein] reductase
MQAELPPHPFRHWGFFRKATAMTETIADQLDLTGRTALVVGGSSGIGNGIAQLYRAQGASVHVWGTRADASAYAGEPGSDMTGLDYAQCDVSDPAAIERQPDIADLDILVLVQGAAEYSRKEFEIDTFRHVVNVNLISVMHCCTKYFPSLLERSGTVIIVSSIGAYRSLVGNPAYASSKAGAVALTRTLGDAWGRQGVRVNGIAPGLFATKMTTHTTANEGRLQRALSTISLGRLGIPGDVASAALFLASPLASYVTGQTLSVDGGRGL